MRIKPLKQRYHNWGGKLNLTPLVDITFQLIVFFMVVSQVVTAEREPMNLPAPKHSQAKAKQHPDRLIINLFADNSGNIEKIKINANVVSNLSELMDVLLREAPALQARNATVILRADRKLKFKHIKKVLKAISNAGITSLEIAAQQERSANTKN